MEFKLFATLNYVKKECGWTQITEPQREKQCKDTHMGISLVDNETGERYLLLKVKKHKVLFFILGHSCHKKNLKQINIWCHNFASICRNALFPYANNNRYLRVLLLLCYILFFS